MSKLYALPDHEVMENLLPGIGAHKLPVEQAIARLRSRPGLTPVAINPHGSGSVYFADIGTAPLLEWKHIYTIERLARENVIGEIFTTDLAILEQKDLATDGISPQGLIFHVSRCGSTLFTKALANSPRNLTINQGGPLQEGFWAAITQNWQHPPETSPHNIRMLRNLVLLMTRQRRPEYQRSFIKFISWNVIYLDLIHNAFPDAAILYLYRNPLEVIATVMQETTAVLRAKGQPRSLSLTGLDPGVTGRMTDAEYLACCFAHYFAIVQQLAGSCHLHLVNYEQLRDPAYFQDTLFRGLGLQPDAAELALMLQQFHYYSKDDSQRTVYTGEPEHLLDILSAHDRQAIAALCSAKLAELDRSRCNLFPQTKA